MIFLSYAQKDGTPYVERLETALQAVGFETWRDTSNLHPASRIDVTIEDNIKRADVVVVCVTADVERDKSFVRNEIAYASVLDKPIIIARFDNVPPPISIVNRFWIEFHKQTWDVAFAELHRWLKQPLPEQKKLKDGAPTPAFDPFRDYVKSAYEFIVDGLRQRIIVPIDLKAKETPDAVNPPPAKPRSNIFEQSFSGVKMGISEAKPEKRNFSTFREGFEAYEGRALLLGEPGAGKTITLMAYARDAYAARLDDPTQPLPLYNLVPTWDSQKRTPLHEWIAEAHGLDAHAVKREIEAGQTLLLLDGLDELGGLWKIINEEGEVVEIFDSRLRFLQALPANNRILLTSRVQEYEEIAQRAVLNGAILLQPLDDEQMHDYLREQPELLALVERDKQLRELTRTPLLMSIFAFAYKDLPESEREQLVNLKNAHELREKIFMRYIDQRYKHEEDKVNSVLPFALDELKDMLGQVAFESVTKSYSRPDKIEFITGRMKLVRLGIERFFLPPHLIVFTDFAVRLNLFVLEKDKTIRFIHLLLRDMLAFNPLLSALNDGDPHIRSSAGDALGKMGDVRAIDSLSRALNDIVESVRFNALFALADIPDSRAIEIIIATMYAEDPYISIHATNTLMKIRTPAIGPLTHALYDRNVTDHSFVATTLERIGTPEALEAVRKWRESQKKR